MGGKGSGGYRWGVRRTTVEECLILDVNWLARRDLFDHSDVLHLQWHSYAAGAIVYNREACEAVLTFQIPKRDPVDQFFRISRSACHMGGVRFWLMCPLCLKRASKLYFPFRSSVRSNPFGFACRHCLGLTYSCRNTKDAYRLACRHAARLKQRLVGVNSLLSKFPPKPRRMRWLTYQRHLEEFSAAWKSVNGIVLTDTVKQFPDLIERVLRANGGPE